MLKFLFRLWDLASLGPPTPAFHRIKVSMLLDSLVRACALLWVYPNIGEDKELGLILENQLLTLQKVGQIRKLYI